MANLWIRPKFWWVNNIGQNTLSGIPDDPDHPVITPDYAIRFRLMRYPIARNGFNQIMSDPDRPYEPENPDNPEDPAFDKMLLYPEEKARLNAIIERYPIIRQNVIQPWQDVSDQQMKNLNGKNIQQGKPGRMRSLPMPRRGPR